MNLPETIQMKNTAHGRGDKGMAFYAYQDAEALGVLMDARRAARHVPFVETWWFRWLPDQSFTCFADLRAAVASLTDEQIATEKAKWPQLVKPPEPATLSGNSLCWLHADRPRTHRGWVQTSWLKTDGDFALLCDECAAAAATDPGVVVRASEARRAYCASLPDPLTALKEKANV